MYGANGTTYDVQGFLRRFESGFIELVNHTNGATAVYEIRKMVEYSGYFRYYVYYRDYTVSSVLSSGVIYDIRFKANSLADQYTAGTLKVRVSGTTLYMRNDGGDA